MAVLASLAAGCGSSKPPSVASIGSTASAAGRKAPAHKRASRTALGACFRAHGFQAALGSAGNAPGNVIALGGVIIPGADPQSARFRQAMQACRRYLPGGGPPTMSPAQRAVWAKAMAKFAACMRKHGVPNFPDPAPGGTFPEGAIAKLNPPSPFLAKASRACQHLESNVGPRIALG